MKSVNDFINGVYLGVFLMFILILQQKTNKMNL